MANEWDRAMNASKLDLTPPAYRFGDLPVGPVSVPGKTMKRRILRRLLCL